MQLQRDRTTRDCPRHKKVRRQRMDQYNANHFKETGAKEVKNGMKCAPIIYQPQTTQPWGTTEVGRPSGLALERHCCYWISQVVC
jgi:hypothetical protein